MNDSQFIYMYVHFLKVLSWGRNDNSWRQCVWTHRRPFSMHQMAFSQQNMIFITPEGESFLEGSSTRETQVHRPQSSSICLSILGPCFMNLEVDIRFHNLIYLQIICKNFVIPQGAT